MLPKLWNALEASKLYAKNTPRAIPIHPSGSSLPRVDEMKYFGLYFDKTLIISSHAKYAKQRAFRALGIVCRKFHDFYSAVAFVKLYSTVCLEYALEYSSVV